MTTSPLEPSSTTAYHTAPEEQCTNSQTSCQFDNSCLEDPLPLVVGQVIAGRLRVARRARILQGGELGCRKDGPCLSLVCLPKGQNTILGQPRRWISDDKAHLDTIVQLAPTTGYSPSKENLQRHSETMSRRNGDQETV
jgi:hypothetical protein